MVPITTILVLYLTLAVSMSTAETFGESHLFPNQPPAPLLPPAAQTNRNRLMGHNSVDNATVPLYDVVNATAPLIVEAKKPSGKGKGQETEELPDQTGPTPAPVCPTKPINNDLGVSPNMPSVPFTPHIDDKITPPLTRFNPVFGAEIPKRPKCKPKHNKADKAAGDTSATKGKKLHERDLFARDTVTNIKSDLDKVEFYFGQPLERNINRLPAQAEFKPSPWVGSYWPIYRDSVNARWAPNELPPSDKYAKAFGLNVAQFRESVSRNNGILSQSRRRACSSNQDCRTLNDGSVCAKRDGETRGFCIPTWFGICHAWAPASIMEPEPKCPVTKNGVTFRPFDIKALITLAWDGARAPTVFTGARYDGPEKAATDRFGRFTDAAYRDLNPGFFHMYMANVLGRFGKSFVVDVTASAEVWNQPIRSYQIVQQTVMTPRNAARRYFNSNTYPFNPAAKGIAFVRAKLAWIVEGGEDGALVGTPRMEQYTVTKEFTYLLELDRASQIIGGEWVGESMKDHPDFAWFPAQRPSLDAVTSVGLSYRKVRELLDESIRGRC